MEITRTGIDLAIEFIEVYGVCGDGKAVAGKPLRLSKSLRFFANLEPCFIGMEACGGAHHWAGALSKRGQTAKVIAAQCVRPFRKNDNNDRNDAEAICEPLGRPSTGFVPVKNVEQQAVQRMHRAPALPVGERTALVNQTRGLLTEYGIVVHRGMRALRSRLLEILEDAENGLPALPREIFAELRDRLHGLEQRVQLYDRRIEALARESESACRLIQLEGLGALSATTLVATVGDARKFNNGCQFAAWLGLVPRHFAIGGKAPMGWIRKRGDVYLPTLLVNGARSLLRTLSRHNDANSRWICERRALRWDNIAGVALAAKRARIIWAMLAHNSTYRPADVVSAVPTSSRNERHHRTECLRAKLTDA